MDYPWPLSQLSYPMACTMYDQYHEGVLITDKHGWLVYYNPRMANLDGFERASVLGRHVLDIYKLSNATSITMRCLTTGRPVQNAALYYRANGGNLVNALCNAYPIYEEGKIAGCICYTAEYTAIADKLDITARNFASHKHIVQEDRETTSNNGTSYTLSSLVGESIAFKAARETAKIGARSPSSIMIYGETGTGKELFAQAIHNHSPRRIKAFCPINCAAIPENLLEGILFGTAKGAFTGSLEREGLFEVSSGGTIFLDEIHTMPMGLQAKLLRVLQERRIRRVGGSKEIAVDLKIISSINQNPEEAIKNGLLRPDLFYRLGVILLAVPALRSRENDISILINHFIKKNNKKLGCRIIKMEPEFLNIMESYQWPGNVRELEHVVETAMNYAANDQYNKNTLGIRHIQTAHLRKFLIKNGHKRNDFFEEEAPKEPRMETVNNSLALEVSRTERQLIEEALNKSGGIMAQAARIFGVSRQNFYYKMKKYGLNQKANPQTMSLNDNS